MDDEVMEVGGTIVKHVDAGDEVYVCFVAHRIYNHTYDERQNQIEMACAIRAKDVLGYHEAKFLNLNDERLDLCIQDILIPLEEYVLEVNPQCVYLNHKGDNHQDHRAVFEAAMIALRTYAVPTLKTIFCYETPSSTEQSVPSQETAFLPNYYVNIKQYLSRKIEALECYEHEIRKFPHPRSAKGIEIWAKKRGMEAGFEAAEALMMIRGKWD